MTRCVKGNDREEKASGDTEWLRRCKASLEQLIRDPGGSWGARVGRGYLYDRLLNFPPLRASSLKVREFFRASPALAPPVAAV